MPSFLATRLGAAALAVSLAVPCLAQAPAACTDFDAYVNGRWAASTELPASRARIGSFDGLRMANDRLLEGALAELADKPALQGTPGLRLLATYYRSGMDEAAIERAGLSAVQPLLSRLDALDRAGLPIVLGELAHLQIEAPFAVGVGPDPKEATRYALQFGQDGLGLPDRDDYFKTDELTRRVQAAYRKHVQRLLQAAEAPADDATLDALMAFEAELASASMTRVQRRDPNAVYNPVTVAQLQSLAPGLDWLAWQQAYTGRAEAVPMILGQPAFAQAVARLAARAPLDTWRAYLTVRVLNKTAQTLPRALAQSHFEYHSATVRGLKAAPPRVEQVILTIGGNRGSEPLGQALGELYVSKNFSPLAQKRAEQMVVDIKAAMRERIANVPWMSAPTKALATAKLDAMVAKIGAPQRWPGYPGLVLQADDYAGNLLRVNAWATQQRVADIGQAVDRARWNTSPHIVNAFAAAGNQIVFPAGILQPPFFDATADDASNYGAIGAVIGHEITHHFDDRGRQFDSVGNLRDWWAAEDAAAYKARAERVAALYSSFEPVPGVHINGHLTLGENISDMAGVQLAYAALQRALERQRQAGQAVPLVDGLTPEQRFFTAHAIIWRSKQRIEAIVNQVRTDGHSPARFRVLGPLSHMPAFAKAFACKSGDAMVAAEPVSVW